MGGGHWITKPFYDRDRLVRLVREARTKYDVDVWLEPGEAVAIHTGVLRATVMDVFESAGHKLAILDISATAHMPDVLEMPYRPDVFLVERSADFSPHKHRLTSPAVTISKAKPTTPPPTPPIFNHPYPIIPNLHLTASAAPPASRAMSSATYASPVRCNPATPSSSTTWPTTPWSRPPPSTA
jgi:hypothetical protein